MVADEGTRSCLLASLRGFSSDQTLALNMSLSRRGLNSAQDSASGPPGNRHRPLQWLAVRTGTDRGDYSARGQLRVSRKVTLSRGDTGREALCTSWPSDCILEERGLHTEGRRGAGWGRLVHDKTVTKPRQCHSILLPERGLCLSPSKGVLSPYTIDVASLRS